MSLLLGLTAAAASVAPKELHALVAKPISSPISSWWQPSDKTGVRVQFSMEARACSTFPGGMTTTCESMQVRTMKITTILSVPPESLDVRTLYEVFGWGREAMAEYLYHGEINAEALRPDGTGDLSIAEYAASVEVSFEPDVIGVNRQRIDGASTLDHSLSLVELGDLTAQEASQLFGQPHGDVLLESDENSLYTLWADAASGVCVISAIQTCAERSQEVRVFGAGCGVTLGTLLARAETLRQRYRDIPMHRFSGAVRE
ncbi:hypothetical protein [Luteimonas terrae]|uniref:Uncharacterized protein n=1 Tax=Luteimonas terrae TaxID=1530191 RepID=A0ABU1XUH9_9GAMM|nr:hypothetical protein [Luteimonas terrae]MDR7192421.1 hypothetical protein [Luteimonas terrae]